MGRSNWSAPGLRLEHPSHRELPLTFPGLQLVRARYMMDIYTILRNFAPAVTRHTYTPPLPSYKFFTSKLLRRLDINPIRPRYSPQPLKPNNIAGQLFRTQTRELGSINNLREFRGILMMLNGRQGYCFGSISVWVVLHWETGEWNASVGGGLPLSRNNP